MFLAVHVCGHVSKWRDEATAPKVGEVVVCGFCPRVGAVTQLLGPWRVRCHDCHAVNHHATFRTTVLRRGTAHAQEFTSHRVWVWRYGDPDSKVLLGPKNVGAQPPLFTDAPF